MLSRECSRWKDWETQHFCVAISVGKHTHADAGDSCNRQHSVGVGQNNWIQVGTFKSRISSFKVSQEPESNWETQ